MVIVATSLIFISMAATAFSAEQSPKVQQTMPLKAAPARVSATLGASPASYSGNCPALITFKGHITVSQPTTVQYKFIRSDNAQAPVQTINFPKAGTQEVTTTWQLGGAALPAYSGWEAIQVISPVSVQSNKASFSIRCAGQQQGGSVQQPVRPLQPGAVVQKPVKPVQPGVAIQQPVQQVQPGDIEAKKLLPDLAIVDITLNEQCFVVVTAKNNGPGAVPDKVWTERAPDSSAVYLLINGKKWGGQTIAGFDPAKNLQKPGGMATMTSNLKIKGTATIEATIDITGKVKETNEENNVMKKQLTCQERIAAPPGVVAQPVQPEGTAKPGVLAQPGNVVKPGMVAQPSAGKEDCISFNYATATVQQIQGRWKIVDGNNWLFDFGNKESEAKKSLNIITKYRMNQVCFVGRPNPSFQYMLVSGSAPAGALGGEDCVPFNPATTTVQQIKGSWKMVDGNHWMFDFGANKEEADQTLAIIKKYGFTYSCFVGRPGPEFKYLRK
jgi:hypothetical protein